MSLARNQILKQILLSITILSVLTLIRSDDQLKSYVKVYKSESAVSRELNKDFVNVGIQNLINNLTYPSVQNYTSPEFPGSFLDLEKIVAAGSSFSINEAYVVNTNSSTIATDPTNSSFIYFSGNFNFRNSTNSQKGEFTVTLTSSEVIYIKEFTKGESGFKYSGKISLMWKDPEFGFEGVEAPAKALVSLAFKETFNSKIKEGIEKELNSELANYLSKQTFDMQFKFNITQAFSGRKIPANALTLNLLSIDAIVLKSKYDTLLTQHFTGYLNGFAERKDLPAESGFDVKTLDLDKLYIAAFLDKFIFESLVAQEAFKGFFLRKGLTRDNIPKAINFDLDMRSVAQVLPEISNLYSLMQNVEINYAIFNPRFDFSENKTPKIIANLDFTVYAVNAEKQLNQVFTCQTDLAFEITDPLNKTPYLNFNIELIDIGNLKMSNNFSYVNIDHLKFLIRELVNYAIGENKVFQKDVNLSDLFEEDFDMKFYKGGVLLYYYLN